MTKGSFLFSVFVNIDHCDPVSAVHTCIKNIRIKVDGILSCYISGLFIILLLDDLSNGTLLCFILVVSHQKLLDL